MVGFVDSSTNNLRTKGDRIRRLEEQFSGQFPTMPGQENSFAQQKYFKITGGYPYSTALDNAGSWSTSYAGTFMDMVQDIELNDVNTLTMQSYGYAAGAFLQGEIVPVSIHEDKIFPTINYGDRLVLLTVVDAFGTSDESTNCTVAMPLHCPDARGTTVTAYNVQQTASGSTYGMDGSASDAIWCQFLAPGKYLMVQKACS